MAENVVVTETIRILACFDELAHAITNDLQKDWPGAATLGTFRDLC